MISDGYQEVRQDTEDFINHYIKLWVTEHRANNDASAEKCLQAAKSLVGILNNLGDNRNPDDIVQDMVRKLGAK